MDDLDYERKQHYELVIRATDSVSGVSAEVPVSILVQDVNDCLPEFEMDSFNVSVSEGASFGTAILKVVAHDNDTGINQMVTYAIQTDSKNSSDYFQMDPVEGVIYLKKSLDHEQLAVHHFTVVAIDKGVPSLSSTAHVWVKGQYTTQFVFFLNSMFLLFLHFISSGTFFFAFALQMAWFFSIRNKIAGLFNFIHWNSPG